MLLDAGGRRHLVHADPALVNTIATAGMPDEDALRRGDALVLVPSLASAVDGIARQSICAPFRSPTGTVLGYAVISWIGEPPGSATLMHVQAACSGLARICDADEEPALEYIPSSSARSLATLLRARFSCDVIEISGRHNPSGTGVIFAREPGEAEEEPDEAFTIGPGDGTQCNNEQRAMRAGMPGDLARSPGMRSAIHATIEKGEWTWRITAGNRGQQSLSEGDASVLAALCAPFVDAIARDASMLEIDEAQPDSADLTARINSLTQRVADLREEAHRWATISDVLAEVSARESVEEIAGPVTSTLLKLFDGDECSLIVARDDLIQTVGISRRNEPARPADAFPPRPRSELPTIAFGVATDHLQATLPGVHPGRAAMRSEMFALIGEVDRPLGLITIRSERPEAFNASHAAQLHRVVRPLRAALHYFEGRRRTELRARQLEKVNRILASLSAGGSLVELSQQFLRESRLLFGASMAAITRFDEDGDEGEITERDSDIWDVALPARLPLAELNAGWPAGSGAALVMDARTEGSPARFAAQLQELGLYSALRVPLLVKGHVAGAITLWGEGTGRFTEEDADLLAAVTRPFAIAVEKAAVVESLAESERRYRTLVSRAEEMIFLFDAETHALLDGNAFAARTLGYSEHEFLHLKMDDFFDGDPSLLNSDVQALLHEGDLHISERRYRRVDGSSLEVDIVASAITYEGRSAILTLARDVSEHKSLQRQLVQSQKMESLGSMAGMVAHDFNNLLTTILGFAGLLKRSTTLDSEERENLGLIEDAARRAADLTGRLLAFARGGLARFGPVDLQEVVNDTLNLAATAIPQTICLTTDLPGSPVLVEGDSVQLQSALLNIVLNAKDAMPDGGTLHLALSQHDSAATLVISDNGSGMDDETRTRIFEPFYTTKPAGSGTGLGMAITYGIVQGHHGGIAVKSKLGEGTRFEITLPRLPDTTGAREQPQPSVGDGTLILIVDDDEMVRRSTSATLAHMGYNVVQAASGATAIELVRARPERFAAILLDLVMPGLNGSETFRAVTAIRADLPVIICTGYAAEAHIDTDVKRRIAGLLQKPFAAERLAVMLSGVGAPPPRPLK